MGKLLVSVCSITYNHAPYIRECLDGFLMQQCDFDFEVLIYDDASNDGTQEIIKEYQEKYPDIIKPILQTENQYSQGVRTMQSKYNFFRAKGKYIALCEGDDYWTDPLKLQRQVDILEANPDFSLICGGYIRINHSTKEQTVIVENDMLGSRGINLLRTNTGFEVTFDMMKARWMTKTLTSMYRADNFDIKLLTQYQFARDVHMFYHLMKAGRAFYIQDVLGVYNVHEGGVFSLKSKHKKNIDHYNLYRELFIINKDEYTRYKYFHYCLELIKLKASFSLKEYSKTISCFTLLKQALLLAENRTDYLKIIKATIPSQLRTIFR